MDVIYPSSSFLNVAGSMDDLVQRFAHVTWNI